MKFAAIKNILYWLSSTLLVILLAASCYLLFKGISYKEIIDLWPTMFNTIVTSPIGWLIIASPFLLFKLSIYLHQSYKQRGKIIFFRRFSLSILFPAFSIFAFSQLSKSFTHSEIFDYKWNYTIENTRDSVVNRYQIDGKQRGMHLFWRDTMSKQQVEKLLKNNIEWIF